MASEIAEGDSGTPRHACLLAQQAAEKKIKAVLIRFQIAFPKTHDLDRLRSLLPADIAGRLETAALAELTEWAVESMYPGDWPEMNIQDAQRAVQTAEFLCETLSPYAD